MSNSKYTPGPWHARGLEIISSDGSFVGIVNLARASENDAKLFAAAPTMLLALRLIAGLSAGWDDDGSTGPKEPLSWESVGRMALDHARAAIAKAEGSAS